MIGPIPPGGGGGMDDPWEAEFGTANAAAMAAWRERERRQRTVRLLMMFFLMLLLMDGEEQNSSSRRNREMQLRKGGLKSSAANNSIRPAVLEESLFESRQRQDLDIVEALQQHGRKNELTQLNNGRNVEEEIVGWVAQQEEQLGKKPSEQEKNPEDRKKVYHFPWNATGFYRGEWTRQQDISTGDDEEERQARKTLEETSTAATTVTNQYKTPLEIETSMQEAAKAKQTGVGLFLLPRGTKLKSGGSSFNATKLELQEQASNKEKYEIRMRNKRPAMSIWSSLFWTRQPSELIVPEEDEEEEEEDQATALQKLTLTRNSGRVAFQIYSRSVPAMKELSLLEGFVKLYDSSTVGYSSRKDVLLRVRGVILHSIGRISMVANDSPGRSALVISSVSDSEKHGGRRRLEETVARVHSHSVLKNLEDSAQRLKEAVSELEGALEDDSSLADRKRLEENIRDDALALYPLDSLSDSNIQGKLILDEGLVVDERVDSHNTGNEETAPSSYRRKLTEGIIDTVKAVFETQMDKIKSQGDGDDVEATDNPEPEEEANSRKALGESKTEPTLTMKPETRRTEEDPKSKSTTEKAKQPKAEAPWRSNLVFPYPYVLDDKRESIQKAKTPTSRKIPKPEKLLEANAGSCEFELNFDVQPIQWTVGEWKNLVSRRVHETHQSDPSSLNAYPETEDQEAQDSAKKRPVAARMHHLPETTTTRKSLLRDQAQVMEMVGTVHSSNCDFTANINATAIRTNWEHTTGKAINYSFYMMLTCLTQIVVLLRQLLHTQAQSAATRVSLLCIGWQTVLDALLCLGHISLSLSMQPLFTAFASVAFFKLLIFCVIEMKYMAIIMQARNTSNGGQNTAEILRRQVTMLHLRFYFALMAILMAFFYAGEEYRTAYVLFLYSFWIPQIILNIVTEAKRPLHHYYIYGMSISRLVAPLYLFAVPHNFLKEVYPDAPSYPFMCQLLVLWVGFQTAVLIAQGRYGARFMIPARFLPPKFDYSRPIPESLLPPGAVPTSRESSFDEGMSSEVEVPTLRGSDNTTSDRHSSTTRNRIKGTRASSHTNVTTTETPVNNSSSPGGPTLDCVICYNGIDIHNRRGYMLAPCDHIFHRDCLMQWMDVKMECPICRTELPSL